MTQDPNASADLSAERVAALEKKLADAAAEVAEVQAQLSQATGGAQSPSVPYGGQLDDLSAYGIPEVAHHGVLSSPESVAPLADPPRHVPFAYRLATFNLSVYELFILVIGFTAPIAVWIFAPAVLPAALVAAVLVIAWFRGRRYVQRIGVLKTGKVATINSNETLDKGTYYSGMTYNNMRLRRANGWDAETIWYSGPGYKNKVDYTVDGVPGTLKFRGLQYTNGVVLADPHKPGRALCVSQFPYSVKPGPDGQFTGKLTAWLWGGIIATIIIEGTLVYLAVISVLGTYVN